MSDEENPLIPVEEEEEEEGEEFDSSQHKTCILGALTIIFIFLGILTLPAAIFISLKFGWNINVLLVIGIGFIIFGCVTGYFYSKYSEEGNLLININ